MSRSTIVFAERLRQRSDEPADGFVVVAAQQFRFRRRLRLLPERRIVGRKLFVRALRRRRLHGAPREFRLADIAQDRQQPRLHRRAAIAVEMAERPQVAFLHRVFGIGPVAHQIAREREHVVEMRQRRLAKPPRSGRRRRHLTWFFARLSTKHAAPAAASDRASSRRVRSGCRFYHDRAGHVRMQRAEILVTFPAW